MSFEKKEPQVHLKEKTHRCKKSETYLFRRHGADDVGVARVSNTQAADTEVLPASRPEIHVVPAVVMHTSLGKHGIILDLGFPERRTVVGDNDKFALPAPQRLQGGGVAESIFPRLHDQSQSVVDTLLRLLGLLDSHHLACFCNYCAPSSAFWRRYRSRETRFCTSLKGTQSITPSAFQPTLVSRPESGPNPPILRLLLSTMHLIFQVWNHIPNFSKRNPSLFRS